MHFEKISNKGPVGMTLENYMIEELGFRKQF